MCETADTKTFYDVTDRHGCHAISLTAGFIYHAQFRKYAKFHKNPLPTRVNMHMNDKMEAFLFHMINTKNYIQFKNSPNSNSFILNSPSFLIENYFP